MTEPPRLPKAPQTVDAAELRAGADEGSWTDVLVKDVRLAGVAMDDARFVDCRFERCDLSAVRSSPASRCAGSSWPTAG